LKHWHALAQTGVNGLKVIPVTGGCARLVLIWSPDLSVWGVITRGGCVFYWLKPRIDTLRMPFGVTSSKCVLKQSRLLLSKLIRWFKSSFLRLAPWATRPVLSVTGCWRFDWRASIYYTRLRLEDKNACLAALIALGLNAKASSIHI